MTDECECTFMSTNEKQAAARFGTMSEHPLNVGHMEVFDCEFVDAVGLLGIVLSVFFFPRYAYKYIMTLSCR